MSEPERGSAGRAADLAALCWAVAITLAYLWTHLEFYRRALRALRE